MDYVSLSSKAQSLIASAGQPIRYTPHGATEITITAVQSQKEIASASGSIVTTPVILVAGSSISFTPSTKDYFNYAGRNYAVNMVSDVSPGGSTILYEIVGSTNSPK